MVPRGGEIACKATGKSLALGEFTGQRAKNGAFYLITVNDLKPVVSDGLRNSGMFTAVDLEAEKNTNYKLNAKILGQPMEGIASITCALIVDYEITRVGGGEVVYSKRITGKHTATAGQAFQGINRIRMAVEGAARDNVKQLLEDLANRHL